MQEESEKRIILGFSMTLIELYGNVYASSG